MCARYPPYAHRMAEHTQHGRRHCQVPQSGPAACSSTPWQVCGNVACDAKNPGRCCGKHVRPCSRFTCTPFGQPCVWACAYVCKCMQAQLPVSAMGRVICAGSVVVVSQGNSSFAGWFVLFEVAYKIRAVCWQGLYCSALRSPAFAAAPFFVVFVSAGQHIAVAMLRMMTLVRVPAGVG